MKIFARLDDVFVMSNMYSKYTDLPMTFWVDNAGVRRHIKHHLHHLGDRVTKDVFELSISKDPRVLSGRCKLSSKNLSIIRQYVIDNYDVLIQHWNGEIDDRQLQGILYVR